MPANQTVETLKRMVLGSRVKTRVPKQVHVGDRFEEQELGQPVWVVERISSVSGSSFPLVRLRREGLPELVRTLSISALSDKDIYKRSL